MSNQLSPEEFLENLENSEDEPTQDVVEDVKEEDVKEDDEGKAEDAKEEDVKEDNKDEPADDKIELNIDGEVKKLSLDEVKTLASKAAGADKKFREASEVREKALAVKDLLEKDPTKVLEESGHDLSSMAKGILKKDPEAYRAYLENELLEILEKENLPEEVKAQNAAQKKIDELEEKTKQLEEQYKNATEEAELQQFYAEIDDRAGKVIDKLEGLVDIPQVREKLCNYLTEAEARAAKDDSFTFKDEEVGNLLVQDLQEMFTKLPFGAKAAEAKVEEPAKKEPKGFKEAPKNDPKPGTKTSKKKAKIQTWEEMVNWLDKFDEEE